MSADFIARILGLFFFGVGGAFLGSYLGESANLKPGPGVLPTQTYEILFGLLGILFGLILTPYITIRPIFALRRKLTQVSAQTLFASLTGLVVGLVVAALFSFPLSLLPSPLGNILPFLSVMLFCYFGVAVFVMRQNDLFNVIKHLLGGRSEGGRGESASSGEGANLGQGRNILLDTSVIIDGRIADIAQTGFLPGTLLIPRFVLAELQYIADSADSLRRQRGRRGMEVLSRLQKSPNIPVQISDIDVEGTREVDDKLVILARQLRCPVLTNDYNLNRIAELQGVTVLNVNELANAVKSVILPGEPLAIRVIQEGKESGQGVGYMDDGTMVVVESGRSYLHEEIPVIVTKVLQTAAGRMIFARPDTDR